MKNFLYLMHDDARIAVTHSWPIAATIDGLLACCDAIADNGYVCTRPRGHVDGPHVAHGVERLAVARWEDGDDVVPCEGCEGEIPLNASGVHMWPVDGPLQGSIWGLCRRFSAPKPEVV